MATSEGETKSKPTARPRRKIELQEVDFRGDHKGVFTWTEIVNNEILDASKEILGEGTRLKEKLGNNKKIGTILIGSSKSGIDLEKLAKECIGYGADKVIIIDNPDLEYFTTRAYAEAIIKVIKKEKPEIFLFSATTTGRDLAPRIAANLEVGLSADCTEFDIGEFKSIPKKQHFKEVGHFIRPSFGESKLATIIGPWTFPQMATARPGAMLPLEFNPDRHGEIEFMDISISEENLKVKILATTGTAEKSEEKSKLLEAHIVVTGGYGVGKDGFEVLQKFVDVLNKTGHKAALGASRKAVDSGLASHDIQVGQTGKTVRPQFYLAVGVSGAIQHLAGMKFSKKVVVINKDPTAPFFGHADFGLVGRYEDIVPELIKAIESGKKFPQLVGT
jgi:electron transfer flavoprotein alpha subunit